MTMTAFFVCAFLNLVISGHAFVSSNSPAKVSLKYDPTTHKIFKDNHHETETSENDRIAVAMMFDTINQTGWSFLKIQTFDSTAWNDSVQAYSAGFVEGNVMPDIIKMHWQNTMAGECPKPYSPLCSKLLKFLTDNLQWVKQQIEADKKLPTRSAYWHQVELFLYQAAGLTDGVNGVFRDLHLDIDIMSFYLFQVGGDMETLTGFLGNGKPKRPLGSGSCSALVKLLPGNKDLYFAQDTWSSYASMLRVLKVYDFPWKTTPNSKDYIAGRVQTFSSYPGTLMSGDDFYLMSSGLATMETTIGNSNPDNWKYVKPQSVLEGMRSVVANRLATSGQDWGDIFTPYNSGTYNNEWLIVDYNKFTPGSTTLSPGLLTILDQIPGSITCGDQTDLLGKQGYFPSYNVAFYPNIYNKSGNLPFVKKYGDWFTYNKNPRALMFKRDHGKVTDIKTMTKLMRYNDYTHDPLARCNCTPPYSAENAISARSDLNPAKGSYPFGALGHRLHGGMDMKLTSYSMMLKNLTFVAVGGPSWDQQPPFQWSTSDFNATSHLGQPDLWKFDPVLFPPNSLF